MSEERKENQSVQTAASDTKNENIKILGVIESCGYLRVRKEPNKEADVIATIPVGSMVLVVNVVVIDGFFDVYFVAVDGFCMADYIHITYPEKE